MNLLKVSTDFLTRLSEPFAAKDDAQGNRRAIVSAIILVIAVIVLLIRYL